MTRTLQNNWLNKAVAPALAYVLAFCLLLLAVAAPHAALGAGNGSSYITPFPKDDVYNVRVYGDYFAEGLAYGLGISFKGDKRIKTSGAHRRIRAIVRSRFLSTLKSITRELASKAPPIAVIMSGGADRASVRSANGARVRLFSPGWRRAYGTRIDKLVKAFKAKNVAVYWVGLPVMRGKKTNAHARLLNEIVREKVYLNGAKFIDVYSAFVDEDGNYDRFGPDLAGKIRKLRSRDGETFTAAGNRKLAHFVVREIKRDIVQAKAERAVPLAGDEAEQRRINPELVSDAAAQKGWTGDVKLAPDGRKKSARKRRNRKGRRGVGEQRADNSKVSFKVSGVDGKLKTVTITIVRPAIPAAVIALVTRKQSSKKAAQIGDAVPGILRGGLTILSSITPARTSGGGQRRLPPTHTSYYRGLIKGEQLPPRPGRADDFRWPRLGTKSAAIPLNKRPRARAPQLGRSQPRG